VKNFTSRPVYVEFKLRDYEDNAVFRELLDRNAMKALTETFYA